MFENNGYGEHTPSIYAVGSNGDIGTRGAAFGMKMIKADGPKGVQSQTQGEQVRVISKKRDDLQNVIGALREADLDIPLQFENFRD